MAYTGLTSGTAASGAVLNNGDVQQITQDSTAVDTIVNSGGEQDVYGHRDAPGNASGTVVNSGGELLVETTPQRRPRSCPARTPYSRSGSPVPRPRSPSTPAARCSSTAARGLPSPLRSTPAGPALRGMAALTLPPGLPPF